MNFLSRCNISITKLIANILKFKPNKLGLSHFYGKLPQPLMTAFDREVNRPVILCNTFYKSLKMFKEQHIPSHLKIIGQKCWQKCWQKRWEKRWEKCWRKRWRSRCGGPTQKKAILVFHLIDKLAPLVAKNPKASHGTFCYGQEPTLPSFIPF